MRKWRMMIMSTAASSYYMHNVRRTFLYGLTLTWKTFKPFIQATKRDSVVFPDPLTPISNKWPWSKWVDKQNTVTYWDTTSSSATKENEKRSTVSALENMHQRSKLDCRRSWMVLIGKFALWGNVLFHRSAGNTKILEEPDREHTWGCLKIRSMRSTWSSTSLNSTSGTSSSSS